MTHAQPTIVIEARSESVAGRVRSIWQYRAFLGFLAKEIVMRRARGTLLGFWWVLFRPLVPVVTLIFTFTSVKPVETSAGVPYSVFFLSGYITWRLFQSALTYLPRAMTWTQSIMQRAYFPRLLVPLAGLAPTLIEFALLCVAFVIIVIVAWWNDGHMPLVIGWQLLGLIPAVIGALMFALAIGMPTAIIALFFRDVRYALRSFASACMFLTPVVYPITFIPEHYRWVMYAFNPMAAVVELSRWALTGSGHPDALYITLSFATNILLFVASVAFFLRAEMYLGDQL
jgi:homopolymeric O-antigen transport system permease protein